MHRFFEQARDIRLNLFTAERSLTREFRLDLRHDVNGNYHGGLLKPPYRFRHFEVKPAG